VSSNALATALPTGRAVGPSAPVSVDIHFRQNFSAGSQTSSMSPVCVFSVRDTTRWSSCDRARPLATSKSPSRSRRCAITPPHGRHEDHRVVSRDAKYAHRRHAAVWLPAEKVLTEVISTDTGADGPTARRSAVRLQGVARHTRPPEDRPTNVLPPPRNRTNHRREIAVARCDRATELTCL